MDISLFADWAEKHGWKSKPPAGSFNPSENSVLRRYAGLDGIGLLPEFWSSFSLLESADECTWFLFPGDFKEENDPDTFAWNEFERISLEAVSDERGYALIKKWWSRHLPVLMSVRGGYSFYAVDLDSKSVVYGSEPEFEETTTAAASFEDFLNKVVRGEIIL